MGKKKTTKSEETEQWTPEKLRALWIDYFRKNGHEHLPSASLIPAGDPTLLFTTAGMVQFKPYFAGTQEPPARRVVTIQKCLRTTDLETVGKTERHCTFFEMLGNFSFGDYFKREAIRFAWEFSRDHLKITPERIHITIHLDDDEAYTIWNEEIGVPAERIIRLGKEHNWWGPAGDSGACGPCSELYLDRGAERCTCVDPKTCKPGSDCDRFMEYWNIVFNQFHQDTSGNLHPLAQTGIDTGAGLERISMILNGQESVYDTTEMARIIRAFEAVVPELRSDHASVPYSGDTVTPYRVLTDHIRAASFAIADGILPDNTGRGYVIRRIIRRALLFARELGVFQPVLYRIVPEIVSIYGSFYPEIAKRKEEIRSRIRVEEERFLNTLDTGLRIWEQYLAEHRNQNAKQFGGTEIFRLYDTYGFPPEMTLELIEKAGMEADREGFEALMEKQRELASQASSFRDITLPSDLPVAPGDETLFTGYDRLEDESKIVAIVLNDSSVEIMDAPADALLILEKTPFYAEGGGQLGDTGFIRSRNGGVFAVRDTQKKGGLYIHAGDLISGTLSRHEPVTCEVDAERRKGLTQHHTATHLLNASLRKNLGDHVSQTGSLVAADYLRFDFSHPEKIDDATLTKIEADVIAAIEEGAGVGSTVLPIDDAKKTGAVAAFGEKYGSTVRVISVGDDGVLSREFCGGCHVNSTDEIGYFHIVKEGSPGAGNRRIEALAGRPVIAYFQHEFEQLASRISEYNEKVKKELKGQGDGENEKEYLFADSLPDHAAVERMFTEVGASLKAATALSSIREKLADCEKRLYRFQKKASESVADSLVALADEMARDAKTVASTKVIARVFRDHDVASLRKLADSLKEKNRNAVILLGSLTQKGPLLLYMANKQGIESGGDCAALIRETAPLIGGKGGGKPDMAQAGGTDPAGLDQAIEKAVAILAEKIKK